MNAGLDYAPGDTFGPRAGDCPGVASLSPTIPAAIAATHSH